MPSQSTEDTATDCRITWWHQRQHRVISRNLNIRFSFGIHLLIAFSILPVQNYSYCSIQTCRKVVENLRTFGYCRKPLFKLFFILGKAKVTRGILEHKNSLCSTFGQTEITGIWKCFMETFIIYNQMGTHWVSFFFFLSYMSCSLTNAPTTIAFFCEVLI